jgi:hypothetical protein
VHERWLYPRSSAHNEANDYDQQPKLIVVAKSYLRILKVHVSPTLALQSYIMNFPELLRKCQEEAENMNEHNGRPALVVIQRTKKRTLNILGNSFFWLSSVIGVTNRL